MDVSVGWPDGPGGQQCPSLREGTKVTEFSCGQVEVESVSDVPRLRCLVVRYKNLDLRWCLHYRYRFASICVNSHESRGGWN